MDSEICWRPSGFGTGLPVLGEQRGTMRQVRAEDCLRTGRLDPCRGRVSVPAGTSLHSAPERSFHIAEEAV